MSNLITKSFDEKPSFTKTVKELCKRHSDFCCVAFVAAASGLATIWGGPAAMVAGTGATLMAAAIFLYKGRFPRVLLGALMLATVAPLSSFAVSEGKIDAALEQQVQGQIAQGHSFAVAERPFKDAPTWGWPDPAGVRSYGMKVLQRDGNWVKVAVEKNGEKSEQIYVIRPASFGKRKGCSTPELQ